MSVANSEFSQWLISEIEKRGLTYTEVAKRGSISHGRISQVVSGDTPGRSFCVGIAEAFNLPVEFILSKAGLTDTVPEQTPTAAELVYLLSQLPPDEQEKLLIIARSWIEAREREEQRGLQPKTSEAGA